MYTSDYLFWMKNGKQLRIKYNGKNFDYYDNWWTEELFCYDKTTGLFRLYYPESSYVNEFYTFHNEEQVEGFISVAIEDCGRNDVVCPTEIILEDCDKKFALFSIRELATQKIDSMTDDELKRFLTM